MIDEKAGAAAKRRQPTIPKSRRTALEALTDDELRTLRLSEHDTSQFEHLRQQVKLSREEVLALEAEEASDPDASSYNQLAKAQKRMTSDATAMVHFLAPRVMRLRDGEAKRKWRSFVTKLQKDGKSA